MPDFGRGTAIVLIPGIQGRWEWMRPTVGALAPRRRVLTFALSEVRGPAFFEGWEARIDRLLDEARVPSAVVVGVSFGGLIAARYAARHPARTRALVLVSTPDPEPRFDAPTLRSLDRPRRAAPAFALRGIRRFAPEIAAAHADWPRRITAGLRHVSRVLRAPANPARMAEWVAAWQRTDIVADCRRVQVPTLVVTGEPGLDQVVPVSSTLAYVELIDGARHVTLAGTGHMGLVLKPREFAAVINDFIDSLPESSSHATDH